MGNKLTVIVGTNREGSNSEKIALQYVSLAKSEGVNVQVIHLKEVPQTMAFSEMYGNRTEAFSELIKEKISDCEKFIFIVPEYNGGFPGILKTFLDAVPPDEWTNKKAGLLGLSSGRAGALRPMDQLTNVLNYLKVNVLYSKPKLSGIDGLLNEDKTAIGDPETIKQLEKHLQLMIKF